VGMPKTTVRTAKAKAAPWWGRWIVIVCLCKRTRQVESETRMNREGSATQEGARAGAPGRADAAQGRREARAEISGKWTRRAAEQEHRQRASADASRAMQLQAMVRIETDITRTSSFSKKWAAKVARLEGMLTGPRFRFRAREQSCNRLPIRESLVCALNSFILLGHN
jgi:hypothetical protein